MGVNSLPKTVARQRHDCDLNPGPSAPESSTLTTRGMKQCRVAMSLLPPPKLVALATREGCEAELCACWRAGQGRDGDVLSQRATRPSAVVSQRPSDAHPERTARRLRCHATTATAPAPAAPAPAAAAAAAADLATTRASLAAYLHRELEIIIIIIIIILFAQ